MVSSALHEIAGGDEELIAELMAEFRAGLRKSIDLLQAAEGVKEWRDCAHRLKGGALAIGADRIAALAVSAEEQPERRAELLPEVEAAFREQFPH